MVFPNETQPNKWNFRGSEKEEEGKSFSKTYDSPIIFLINENNKLTLFGFRIGEYNIQNKTTKKNGGGYKDNR